MLTAGRVPAAASSKNRSMLRRCRIVRSTPEGVQVGGALDLAADLPGHAWHHLAGQPAGRGGSGAESLQPPMRRL